MAAVTGAIVNGLASCREASIEVLLRLGPAHGTVFGCNGINVIFAEFSGDGAHRGCGTAGIAVAIFGFGTGARLVLIDVHGISQNKLRNTGNARNVSRLADTLRTVATVTSFHDRCHVCHSESRKTQSKCGKNIEKLTSHYSLLGGLLNREKLYILAIPSLPAICRCAISSLRDSRISPNCLQDILEYSIAECRLNVSQRQIRQKCWCQPASSKNKKQRGSQRCAQSTAPLVWWAYCSPVPFCSHATARRARQ